MAILHGSNDLYGASRVLIGDVEILAGMGFDVAVALPADGPLTERLDAAGARVFVERLSVFRRVDGLKSLRVPARLPSCARESDILVTWTLALSGYLGVARLARKRTISSVHEILDGRAGAALVRGTAAVAHACMSNSDTTSRWMVASGARPTDVVRAYPEAPAYNPLPRPDKRKAQLSLLLAGRVNGHKGHLEAVAAVRHVRSLGIDVQLTLLGGAYPGQEQHLEALLGEVDRTEGVSYLGEVPDLLPYLAVSDAILVPTTRPEPFGVVALEGWAAGRRVVGSDQGGLAEAVRMVDGISVRAGEIESLVAAIEAMAADEALRASPRADAPVSRLCTRAARHQAWLETLELAGAAST